MDKGPLLWFGRGKRIDIYNFTAEQLDPVWIGIGLSRIARFAGAGWNSVNVAGHSVMLSHLVGNDINKQRAALMHDVPEIFTGDVPSPIKRACPDLLAIDQRILDQVGTAFGVPAWAFEAIEPYDKAIADDEKLFMFDDMSVEDKQKAHLGCLNILISPMPPDVAATAWTRRFYALFVEDPTID